MQKPLKRAYQRDPQAIVQWKELIFPDIASQAKQEAADIYFWEESGFRADSVYGKTWTVKGHTPVVQVPSQRQSINAASAVNSKGGFWFATYPGAMNGEVFVDLLKEMMHRRKKPIHLVVDGLPAHKRLIVKQYVQSTRRKLTMHFLPGYAPDLNPDELVFPKQQAVQGWLKGGVSAVRLVRQVFTNKDGSTGTLRLVCSDLTCESDDITTNYKKRWQVEVFHKSLKSNASLAKSPTRTVRTQSNHVFMSICAAFKLECLSIKTKLRLLLYAENFSSTLPVRLMLSFKLSRRLRNIS